MSSSVEGRDNRRFENLSHQGLTNAETEEMSVLTKTFEEKTVRQMSLAIDVEVMESERSEAESIFGRLRFGLQVVWWLCRPGVSV